MTSAARPTWAPAKGGNEQGGCRVFGASQKFSSRDVAAHTTLKPRRKGQDTRDELELRNLREELEERETRHFVSKDKSYGGDNPFRLKYTCSSREDRIIPRSIDADDSDGETNNSDDEDDDEDDNEEALIMAEWERMKKERAQERAVEALKVKGQLLLGNPLLNNDPTSFGVKRRWDDDIIFKNQTRGKEYKAPKRFINDTIRNDFHRRLLHKYMK